MNKQIHDNIKNGLIKAYKEYVEIEMTYFEHTNKKKIGKTYKDITKPKIPIKEEFVNPKTGRINHRKVGMDYPTYVYTQEMYDKDYENKLKSITEKSTFAFQTKPDDTHSIIRLENISNPTERDIEHVYAYFEEYKNELISFEAYGYKYDEYKRFDCINPIFKEPTNKYFWEMKSKYEDAKQKWCDKYGAN